MAYKHTLIVSWLFALCIRLVFIPWTTAPTVLSDEVDYFLAARGPDGHPGISTLKYPPLYPLVLTPAARIGDREMGFFMSRIMNAILSSAVVPATWFLWGGAGLLGGCIVGALSPGVITTPLILSENLFVLCTALWLLTGWRWIQSGTMRWMIFHGLIAASCALTRAAGGAMVLATMIFAVFTMRRSGKRSEIFAILAAFAPVIVYLLIRSGVSITAFNDPLASDHPTQISRWYTGTLSDLTTGTPLETLARIMPVPFMYAGLWFIYWAFQYCLYLLMGTFFLPVVVLAGRTHLEMDRKRLLHLLILVSVILVIISANHTLSGVQADQFVRGRYLEPIMPLWIALGLILLPGFRGIAFVSLIPVFFTDIGAVTVSQNRSTDLIYPLRSVLSMNGHMPQWLLLFLGALILLSLGFLWMRLMISRQAIPILFLAVLAGLSISVVRYHRQHEAAASDADIARWLAAQDPHAEVTLDAATEDTDRAKESGIAWVAQQIRFFSTNPLTRMNNPRDPAYVLSDRMHGVPILCGEPASGRLPDPPCLYRWYNREK